MDDNKTNEWDLPASDSTEKTLDQSADDALKKVGEPMTTDLGTNFEHSKPVSLDEGDADVSSDLAYINEQIKQDEAKGTVSSEPLDLQKPATDDIDADITFGDYSDKTAGLDKPDDAIVAPAPFEENSALPEVSLEKNGSLAELAEKSSAKKAELLETIKNNQAELDKIEEIETGIKDLQAQEAMLMEKANGLF